MAWDRNDEVLLVGDCVMLTTGMSLEGRRKARVKRVDGEDVYLTVMLRGVAVEIHRYGSEVERMG